MDITSIEISIRRSYFRIPRICGALYGFWPERHHKRSTIILCFINSLAVALGAIGENAYGFAHLSDLVGALQAFCPGITKLISLLKICWFFTYHKQIFKIIENLREMLIKDSVYKKHKIVAKLSALAHRFCFFLLFSGMTTNAFFTICPLAINIYRNLQGEQVENILPFSIMIPKVFTEYPLYPLTYCVLTLSGAMTVFAFSGVDGFFLCGCMYLSGLFLMLQHDIRSLFENYQAVHRFSSLQNAKIRRTLRCIVMRHNLVINLCSAFTKEFRIIVLMHFLSAAFVLCCSILDTMLVGPIKYP